MNASFPESYHSLQLLAQKTQTNPPASASTTRQYIDRGLIILCRVHESLEGETKQVCKKIEADVASEASEIRTGLGKILDELRTMNSRMSSLESNHIKLSASLSVQIKNLYAIRKNEKWTRLGDTIEPLQVIQEETQTWAAHLDVPNTIGQAWCLGQSAKFVFEGYMETLPWSKSMN